MTVCVVVTTYNGINFLGEQLDSIRLQSTEADRVLISDDGSTDGTGRFTEEYIAKYQLKNWECIIREKNLGWKRNFIETMKSADTDIILLADQDDIWESDKIERYVRAFEEYPGAMVIAGNYSVMINEREKSQQVFDRQTEGMADDGSVIRWMLTKQFHIIDRPGCVYGVRNSFFQSIVKYYPEDHPHDSFLWLASVSVGGLYLLQKKLIRYRRHSDNAIKKKTIRNVRLSERLLFSKNEKYICENMLCFEHSDLSDEEKAAVKDFIDFCGIRIEFFESRKLRYWLTLFFRYRGYYTSLKSVAADLAITVKGR